LFTFVPCYDERDTILFLKFKNYDKKGRARSAGRIRENGTGILESFEKRMKQFILQAVKQSQGTVYNLEGAFVSLAFTDETGTIHLKKLTN